MHIRICHPDGVAVLHAFLCDCAWEVRLRQVASAILESALPEQTRVSKWSQDLMHMIPFSPSSLQCYAAVYILALVPAPNGSPGSCLL